MIKPDYSKTVVQVYVDLARNLLECGNINVLYYAGLWKRRSFQFPPLEAERSDHSSWANYLPTWVPDFQTDNTYIELAEIQFRDLSSTDAQITQSLDLSIESYRLTTQAKLIDIISFVPPPLFIYSEALRTNDVNMFFAIRQFCMEIKRTFNARFDTGRYPNGKDSVTAYAHAIVGGHVPQNDRIDRDPLDQWRLYEKYCIEEDGEVYLTMQEESRRGMIDRKTLRGVGQGFDNNGSLKGGAAWSYHHHLISIFRRHWFFISDDGYAGLAPMGSQTETDILVFINGANIPFVIRDMGEGRSENLLIGPCYIYGLMDGETAKDDRKTFADGVGKIQII